MSYGHKGVGKEQEEYCKACCGTVPKPRSRYSIVYNIVYYIVAWLVLVCTAAAGIMWSYIISTEGWIGAYRLLCDLAYGNCIVVLGLPTILLSIYIILKRRS